MKVEAKITTRFNPDGPLKAIVTVILDDCFAINGVKVVESKEKGLFVAMPSNKVGKAYKDVCHPTTAQLRKDISQAVLNEYHGD